jgi:matrixin
MEIERTPTQRPRHRLAATVAIGLSAGVCAIGIGPSAATHAAAPVEGIAYSVSAPLAAATAASPADSRLFQANDDGFTVNDVTGNAAADDAQFAVGSLALSDAETIAIDYWGAMPCNGSVDVSWQNLDPSINGVASWWNPVAAYGNASANSQCSISMNLAQDYSWPMLCTVVTHEIGHLTGHDHVTDQTNVMYPVYVGPIPQCVAPPIGVPQPAGASAATSSTRGTVTAKAAKHKKAPHKHKKRTHKK